MKMIINETGEHKTLSIIDQATGVDWANDLIGNSGAIGEYINYDEDAEAYRIDHDNYDWWADYIDTLEADEAELAGLRENYDSDTIQAALNEAFAGINDYDDHHGAYQAAFAAIRRGASAL